MPPVANPPIIRLAPARTTLAVLATGALALFLWIGLKDRAPNAFHPHGYCYLWQPSLVGLLVASDLSIWLSYTAIAITLAWFVHRGRHAVPFGWVFLAFGGFIVACGTTHLMDVVTLWKAWFWLTADVKLVTAIASVATAAALPPLVPKVLALVEAARVSEQRKAELEIAVNTAKAEEARFRTLFESAPDALVAATADGRIQLINTRAETLFGYTRVELAGRSLATLVGSRVLDRDLVPLGNMYRASRANGDDDGDVMARRKDGTSFPVEISLSAVTTPGGDAGVIAVIRDITERRQTEEQQAQLEREKDARREAEAASHAKDELLSLVSHELRTPLNAILGWSVLLRSKSLDEQAASRAIEVIERNALVQRQVVEDLLDVSRIVAGKLTLDAGAVDLPALLQAAVDSIRPSADVKGVRIEIAPFPSLPPIAGDSARLQQVFWNLLSNGVKFTSLDGVVRISATATPSSVRVEVADTGIGIDPEFLPHVFERFRQRDSSTTRPYGGLGLGLTLVRHIIEWHGGTVEAHSAGAGKGATFVVTLPAIASPR